MKGKKDTVDRGNPRSQEEKVRDTVGHVPWVRVALRTEVLSM